MQYDFNLAPGGGQRVEAKGRFFKYLRGSGMLRITTSKGGYVDLVAGQGIYGVDFEYLMVQDKSGFQNTGVVLAGDYDFRDDAVSNTVRVVDNSKDLTAMAQAFMAGAYTGGGATWNCVSLLNPAASQKNTIIKKVAWVGAALGGRVRLYIVPSGYVQGGQQTAAKSARNKLSGAANSVSLIAGDAVGANPAGAWGEPLFDWAAADGGQPYPYKFEEPVILKPGAAAILYFASGINGNGYGDFEFSEEAA